ISAVSVNADSIRHAWNEKRDLLDEIRRGKWSATIWSPEKLTARGMDEILQDPSFRKNLVCLAIDEVHVVNQWGHDFRQAYSQIGVIRKRIGHNVPILAATATLVEGPERNFLTHTLTGCQFPDILWVLDHTERVIIYCTTIDLLFRVALYLWRNLPPGPERLEVVRVWNSLTSARYNGQTLELWHVRKARIIVATVSFGLGINRSDIPTVINLGMPELLSLDLQQRGRAGRDLESATSGSTSRTQ
ncbi:P-loop containing nucleoside triphosphate hydrolase protein, partial [Melanogaster broomeanus]